MFDFMASIDRYDTYATIPRVKIIGCRSISIDFGGVSEKCEILRTFTLFFGLSASCKLRFS